MIRRRERLLTALTLAGLTAVFFAAVHLPGRRADAALREEIALAETEIARAPLVLHRYHAARQELDRRHTYLEESAASVAEPHDLLDTVSRIAKASGLVVVRLEPEPARPQASYVEHPYRLEFRGGLASAANFLRGLEESPRIHSVNELKIRQPSGLTNGVGLEGTLRFTVFAVPADPAALAEENGSSGAP